MKAIIMAAGVGSRLSEISSGKPKCLIKAAGETLIKRIVRVCSSRGIDDVTVITGYEKDLIHEELGQAVEFAYNPFYPVTNSISSLWLTREKLKGDVILMNADLFFEPSLLDALLRQRKSVVMLSDSTRIKTADYRFCFKGDQITHYGKHLSNSQTDGEYVGMARIDSSFTERFLTRLENMIEQGRTNSWWEEVLYSFIPQGVPIYHHDVAGTFWTEIDDPKDYDRLQAWLRGRTSSITSSAIGTSPMPAIR
ncbi:MAG: choline-phosphate cytidylyltransferase [Elusimicrobia bacterium]|nr:MAG: choline-phosphate cytidylyltransferase [Elusimicrobiota bacterium]